MISCKRLLLIYLSVFSRCVVIGNPIVKGHHLIRAGIVAEILALRMKKPTDGFVLPSLVTPVIQWATAGVHWDIGGTLG